MCDYQITASIAERAVAAAAVDQGVEWVYLDFPLRATPNTMGVPRWAGRRNANYRRTRHHGPPAKG